MIRIPRRLAVLALAVIAALLLVTLVTRVGLVATVFSPRAVATHDEVVAQQASTERAIQRAYAGAADTLHKARGLRLAITDAQAAAIEKTNLDDLKTLRHNALLSLAQAFSVAPPDAERYATATEQRLDALGATDRTVSDPVLLAPVLYTIVQRMDEVSAQIADRGVRQMTASPTGSPQPTKSP